MKIINFQKIFEDVDCNSKSVEDRPQNCEENEDHTVCRELDFEKKMYKLGAFVEVVPNTCIVKPYWKVPLIGLLEAYLLNSESNRYLYQGLVSLLHENPSHIGPSTI